jgi:phosphoribosylglycinamide formyltransferase-1
VDRVRLAVLLSGRGSNFQAIHEGVRNGVLDGDIVCVISNRPNAPGIEKAREWGYDAHVLDHKTFANRPAHEAEVQRVLEAARPDYIALAGYMRLLSAAFVERWRNRLINIHPSLLPAFPGVDAQAQALAYGVRVAGCTVHFVDEHLDAGPIIVQRAVEVLDSDDEHSLAARILVQEHEAYVEALVKLATRRYEIAGRRVVFS